MAADPVARASARAAKLFGAPAPEAAPEPVREPLLRAVPEPLLRAVPLPRFELPAVAPPRVQELPRSAPPRRRKAPPSTAAIMIPGILLGGVMAFALLLDDPSELRGVPQQLLGKVLASSDYLTCAQVRLSGVGPLRRGQKGYSKALDTDGDGVACEPIFGAATKGK
ncbi:MAG: excalibur calcium-binding domain-containing protein [Polymorphobacter sp.]